jgi:fluoroacetyl-CoA thioesterase
LIEIGAVREETIDVDDRVSTKFLGLEGARVLSTPHMIGHMEATSRNLLLPMLDPGYDTVGTEVHVSHLAAAPMGEKATFRSEIVSVEGRRVTFRVSARDSRDKLGEGTHQRFIIHVERFAEKMRKKLESRTA